MMGQIISTAIDLPPKNEKNKSLSALAILHAFEYQDYNFMSGSQMPVCPVCSYKNSQLSSVCNTPVKMALHTDFK